MEEARDKEMAVRSDLRVYVASEKHRSLGNNYLILTTMMSNIAFKIFASPMFFLGKNPFLLLQNLTETVAHLSHIINTQGCGV